jgi:hypothetical protein
MLMGSGLRAVAKNILYENPPPMPYLNSKLFLSTNCHQRNPVAAVSFALFDFNGNIRGRMFFFWGGNIGLLLYFASLIGGPDRVMVVVVFFFFFFFK